VADYFVEYVRQQMQARFGDQLYRDGLRIYTTLDLDMQVAAERALETQLSTIEAGGPRYGKWNHPTYAQYLDRKDDAAEGPSQSPYLQGLVLTLEAKTGFVRALVGGRDFGDSKFNRVTQSRRQPGSTFKPIVFAAALEQGHTLSELVVDEPFSLDIPGQDTWSPQNYDLKFGGQMTLRRALYDSRNVPTIKLGRLVGEQTVIDEARRFGISTNVRAVPSIHIGSADVVPLEMIASFTAFANTGVRTVPQAILRVEDRAGRIIWQPQPKKVSVLEPAVAWLVTDVLRDVVRRGTASGTVGSQINFPAAGKTGTTNDGFDVWFIGFTPELVTGVWMGFDQPKKIAPNAQGGRLAAPAWTMMMNEVYARRPLPGGWSRPADLVVAEIDTSSGGLATPFCPREYRSVESYAPGTAPVAYCPIHSQLLGVPGMTPTPAQPPAVEVHGDDAERPGARTGEGKATGAAAAIPGAATAGSQARPRLPEAPTARPTTVPPPRP
jgi:penicillin-binding protein 1A